MSKTTREVLIVIGAIVLIISVILGISFWINKIGCDQRNESRPSIHMEWHWSTGCIYTEPNVKVVILK